MAKTPSITRRTIYHFMRLSKRYKFMLFINTIAPIMGVVLGTIVSRYFLAVLFGQLAKATSIPAHMIWGTFYLLMALVIAEVLFWRLHDYTFLARQSKTLRDMEQYLFDKMQAHSYRFYSDNFAGSLTTQYNRFLKSYETLDDILRFELVPTAVTIFFAVGVLFFIARPLGIALLIWSVLFITIITWLTVKKSPLTRAAANADSRVTAAVADVITNMLNVKIFARSRYERKRFEDISDDRYKKRWRSWLYDAHIRNIRWTFVILFMFLYLYLSIKLVLSGGATMAAVLTAQLYIMTIYNQLFNLNRTIQRIELSFSEAAEMTEILDLAPEIKDPKNPIPAKIADGLIEFKSVDFHYADNDNAVFSGFNLKIKPGQKVGLVGHSGSGKSTLTRLLMRFVDIQSGEILIDGQNIAHVTQEDLRANLAFVPQEPILFHRSLADNIHYGNPKASDEEVHKAAKLAHAADFIEALPEKYETLVGERGIKLSGGEKQRVAIARAMLSTSPILVLDEATSALDSKSEKLITTALDSLMKNRTTIVVAHRLSTIRKMDRILVMKDGAIIEDGDHDTLLEQKGEYAELWDHQSGGFIDE
jgi:ATP-binding cassette subfamily B protein